MIFVSLVCIASFYILLHLLTYSWSPKVSCHQLCCPPCPPIGVSWCSLIISALNFSFLGMYTFPSFSISPSCSHHSSSLKTFPPARFISSTAFTTSSSFASFFHILLRMSTPSMITSDTCVALVSNHFFFTNICSSLSFSTPISQSNFLLNPSAFSILLLDTCFRIKSNLDKYSAYLACRLFNFWLLIKYSRFLWSNQISNFPFASSRKCLQASRHRITANISLS